MLSFEHADWMFFRTFIIVCLYQGGEKMYGCIMAVSPHWYNQLPSTRLMGCNLLFPDINSNQQSKRPTIHDLVKTFGPEHQAYSPFLCAGSLFFLLRNRDGKGQKNKTQTEGNQ